MAYPIELVSIGADLYGALNEAIERLNSIQDEFHFTLPPPRLRASGLAHRQDTYTTPDVFRWLLDYRRQAKGNRPFLIGFVDTPLSSPRLSNLFASHEASDGVAVVTIKDATSFVPSVSAYLSYYLIRFALSFVAPALTNHDDTRHCFFDRKLYKPDIMKSLESGRICDEHLRALKNELNDETERAILRMIAALSALVHLPAASRSFAPQEPTRGAPQGSASTTPRSASPVFTWIHLSDIHFGAGDEHWRFDQKAVTRAITEDSALCPWPIDRIFVTGDVAFSAKGPQYKLAAEWLAKLSSASGVGLDRVRVVPGNHDVDRAVAGQPLTRALHLAMRRWPREIDGLLSDEDGRKGLVGKLAEFLSFLRGLPGHPALSKNDIDWVERVPARDGAHGPIRVVGLSSVWASDRLDGREDDESSHFVANMVIGRSQLEETIADTSSDELLFVLTHHPPSWMHGDSEAMLMRELSRHRHIHLCGHVHQARARRGKDFGLPGTSRRYVAGASHGDPSEDSKHGYAWGALRFKEGSGWETGWAPRIYVPEWGQMRGDATRYTLDGDGFAWEQIDLPWPAPYHGG